jgi:predicted permease
MDFYRFSLKITVLIIVSLGVTILLLIFGFPIANLFDPSRTEDTQVIIKSSRYGTCVVEGSDGVSRVISKCPYKIGDTISVTYKPQQPSIERHELRQTSENSTHK